MQRKLYIFISFNPPYGKKTVAVHFTTIPCEPNTANRPMESHNFCAIRPCTNNNVCAKFGVFRTFLCFFMNVFRVFVRKELWLNVSAAICLTNRMWFGVVCTLIDNDIRHHSGQNVVDSRGAAE